MDQSSWIRTVFNGTDMLLHQLRCGHLVVTIWIFEYSASVKCFQTAIDPLQLKGLTTYPARRRISTLQEMQTRGQLHHSHPCSLHKLKTLARRVEVLLTQRFQVQRFTKASRESISLTCSVHLDLCQKRQTIWVCVAMCSTRNLVPEMT